MLTEPHETKTGNPVQPVLGARGATAERVRAAGTHNEAEQEELTEQPARIPVAVRRQVFESFDLQIAYDKAEHRVELTATVFEAVANAFENAKALQKEGLSVVATDIAGARFVPRYHARIVDGYSWRPSARLPAGEAGLRTINLKARIQVPRAH